MAKNAEIFKPCQCRRYVAISETGEILDRLACNKDTTNLFAQGHDARLKGFLIKHGAAGNRIQDLSGGTIKDAAFMSGGYGFHYMVVDGIARRQQKVAPALVTAKVGRWSYEGQVDGDKFIYIDKQGVERVTDKFSVQS